VTCSTAGDLAVPIFTCCDCVSYCTGPCCPHFHLEDGGSRVFWNVSILPQHYKEPQPRGWLESSPMWRPQISI